VALEVEKGELAVAGRTLLHDVDLWLERGEHVSLVGPNGAGKTTLVEALAGGRELDAGKLRRGHNANIGYLSQHVEEIGSEGTVLEVTQRATGLTPNKARALLGRFLFSGDEAEKPVDGLSGGERRRLSLAILVSSGANVLILDEPTNHLDLESREALEDALREFPGTVLLVSHDRALLDAVGHRLLAIEDGTLRGYVGGWAEYAQRRAARQGPAKARPKERKALRQRSAAPSKNRLKRIAGLERDIEAAEAALAALEDELSDPGAWATPERSEESSRRHAEAKAAVEQLYEQLEAAGA
jgi:ATP-binding cassette subfamily F protein 3